jgi:hypothetical protein
LGAELFEARALATTFVRKHGRWQRDAVSFLVAERNGEAVEPLATFTGSLPRQQNGVSKS